MGLRHTDSAGVGAVIELIVHFLGVIGFVIAVALVCAVSCHEPGSQDYEKWWRDR
jgi:hypothetical protein